MIEKKPNTFRIQRSLSVCAPHLRTVVIHFDASYCRKDVTTTKDIDVDVEVFHVLTIRSSVYDVYSSSDGVRPESLDCLERRGFRFEMQSVVDEVMFPANGECDSYDLMTISDLADEDNLSVIVPCPWPFEQDERRFSPIVEHYSEVLRGRILFDVEAGRRWGEGS